MTRMVFLNLPVSDLDAAIGFQKALGATQDMRFSDDRTAAMVHSDSIVVMLLTHARFADFTDKTIVDARAQVQGLFALSVGSRDEVDALVAAGVAAGGRADPGPVQDHGFMYGRSCEDPNGHIFELFWMDRAALEQM
ncbi:lactoylglutathione lyase [Stappia indica]|uniref:Lactoylglutathione lyase n=2 Tax=Stappia indica TaxID=538381 RepID=A0A857C7X9_9HYPH|nr:VOC family protein [Stappia indica]QGZ34985.1 lactoylglutathione lyase [Stappia indica]